MRKLSLKKDTLTELTSQELDAVVGGSALSCLTDILGHSDFQQCLTGLGCVNTQSC